MAVPETDTVIVVEPTVESAFISRTGTRPPPKLILPVVKSRRRVRISSRPRRISKPPEMTGTAAVPRIVRLPVSSASMPRPRTKIPLGAFTCRSRLMVDELPLPPWSAPSALACARTFGGAFLCLTSISVSEAGSFSGMVMALLSSVRLPPSTGEFSSGPFSVSVPLTTVVTSVPSL
ncbi:hypothetical protein D3C72_1807060 [compost metagenome]